MPDPKLTLYFDLHSPYSYLAFYALQVGDPILPGFYICSGLTRTDHEALECVQAMSSDVHTRLHDGLHQGCGRQSTVELTQ